MIQAIIRNFVRGLLVAGPLVVTIYVVYFVFVEIDSWINLEGLFNRRLPGVGVVLTVGLLTLTGFLATNFATRWLFRITDRLFRRLPMIKLIYTSIRDLAEAFVGDRRRFDRPVLLELDRSSGLSAMGFLTRDGLPELGLDDHVAVYLPQSYNFAGNLVIAARDRVRPVAATSAAAMTFIVSGGVAHKEGS